MTQDGIKRYTPYFFDKNVLDDILETCQEEHFQSLIERRDLLRRMDVVGGDDVDNDLTDEIVEEMGESTWEPPEVQEVRDEVLDEMGHPGIPLSLISKAAEIQILHAVDKVLLGNRWLRKATRIQPKFPYMVDSFEKKIAASFLRAKKKSELISNSGIGEDARLQSIGTSNVERKDIPDFQFPFGDWLTHPWPKEKQKQQNLQDTRDSSSTRQHRRQELLPKITIVGISKGESGMTDDVIEQLVQVEEENHDKDPLFVADAVGLAIQCAIIG